MNSPQLQTSTLNLNQQDRVLLEERVTPEEKQTLQNYILQAHNFIHSQTQKNSKNIFLLSSGGTSVPLEKNTVRMVQNFSTGTRGSLLGEQILKEGHPLIYFYRDNSFLPFLTGMTAANLALNQNQLQIDKFLESRKALRKYSQNLLLLPFKTIYFYLLGILKLKQVLPEKSVVILCAAVSDFIPEYVSEHKIHTQDSLQIKFKNSPKILQKLVDNKVVTISFKLETDNARIDERIEYAIKRYGIDMVVGNVLNNKKWVKIVYNPKYEKSGKCEQFKDKIQENIIGCALKCLKFKFANKQ